MTVDLSSYKVNPSELSSSTKFDNMVQAVQDALNALPPSQITGYPSDASKFLRGDGTWATVATTQALVTSLPGSPVDAQECILVDSTSAPTFQWKMRYNSTTTKWHFLGGLPALSTVDTAENITSGSSTYIALATAGPSIAIPVAGDYVVEIGCHMQTVAGTSSGRMSYDIGGTGAVDADCIGLNGNVPGQSRVMLKTGLTAVTLTSKYKQVAGGGSEQVAFSKRFMRVTPVKL